MGLTQGGMGVDWGDFNNDARPDLVVATFQNEPASLYRNDGGGLFTEVGAPLGIAGKTTAYVAWTAKFFDYDNDSWEDLLFTNGHSQDNVQQIEADRSYRQPTQLFHNERGNEYRDVSAEAGPLFRERIVGRGAAFGDYDNDGRIDVLLVDEEGPARLLHNEAPAAGRWLGVGLTGVRSNRDAIGATVTVTADGRTYSRVQQICGGYISGHDPRVHFGLGRASRVEKLSVRWPDGTVDTVRDPPVDTYIHVTEGKGLTRPRPS
jgi:hypothetical protein